MFGKGLSILGFCVFYAGAHAEETTITSIPTGPALENRITLSSRAGSFGDALAHLRATQSFVADEVASLGVPIGTVFEPFGSFNPSAFLELGAHTVISASLERFGTPEEIERQLRDMHTIHRSVGEWFTTVTSRAISLNSGPQTGWSVLIF